jgi:pimeloyl-ACP methyl ester carboxylesterase
MAGKIPLVLLPGLLCDAALWGPQVAALADIVEPWVADLSRDDSLSAMAQRVLAAAPARFALAGLSMGGYVAQEIMRQAPQRVTRLALLDTSARADTPERAAQRRGFIELVHKGHFKGITPRMLPVYLHPDHLKDEAIAGAVIGMAERIGKDAYLRQQQAIMDRPDGREDLKRITVPTLALCGRDDQATPYEVNAEIAALVRGATFVAIERCGHISTLEKPAEVNAAMRRWLGA